MDNTQPLYEPILDDEAIIRVADQFLQTSHVVGEYGIMLDGADLSTSELHEAACEGVKPACMCIIGAAAYTLDLGEESCFAEDVAPFLSSFLPELTGAANATAAGESAEGTVVSVSDVIVGNMQDSAEGARDLLHLVVAARRGHLSE